MRRLLTVLLVAGAALAVAVTPAQAHNVLTGSDPRDGARLASVPARVTLTFDQPVRADFAQVALTVPGGAVSRAVVKVDGDKVLATLPATTTPGEYVVGYQIVSNDGHPVTGRIGFTVGAGAPAPAPAAAPPVTALTTSSVPPASGGAWVWGLLVVALLLSGLGILVVARQGRPAKGHSA
ncbi:copper resistance CopC family protein [Sphaerisporangium corydalis]|uniref:Copper resistance protein CopC n=1 Tax=Sphaerisporangium corydalis TaxID=1441875 RepID=A0ABV9EBY4_9ACTN|nr:copper resistance CopC family protein [Sphaerisporangium corydalis]